MYEAYFQFNVYALLKKKKKRIKSLSWHASSHVHNAYLLLQSAQAVGVYTLTAG